MSLWEYKVITSGKGGFATPALLEKFLNDLGRDEWEIVHFQTQPDNFLAFTGLARRSTQRDWTLQDAAAAAAKAEAEKLRAEFEAKFKAASTPGAAVAEERAPSFLEEKAGPEDGLRKLVDTSRDDDPDADDEADDWDKLTAAEQDELPSFFDAMKPHMRRNQRGPGMSVGVDYLAKKWDQSEDDIKGALVECGFDVPADEDAPVVYVEFDGDLYWVNVNRRGELWINTKEKPRPVFRTVKAQRVTPEEPAKPQPRPESQRVETPRAEPTATEPARAEDRGADRPETVETESPKSEAPAVAGAPLPEGTALLAKIRPHMRRNRRGPGGSGSTSFLSRALRCKEEDLKAAFLTLGLVPTAANDKPVYVEIGQEVWWLNSDSRGGLWINGRDKKPGESLAAATAPSTEAAPVEGRPAGESAPSTTTEAVPATALAPETGAVAPVAPAPTPAEEPAAGGATLAAVRLLLKETKTGAIAGKVDRLAGELAKSVEDFTAALVAAGLNVPEKAREKPVFVEHAGEIFWLNRNARGELWLNAKTSKFADAKEGSETGAAPAEAAEGGGEKRSRRPRSRKKAE